MLKWTLYTLVRDSSFGSSVYHLSNKRLFRPYWDYYDIPEKYFRHEESSLSNGPFSKDTTSQSAKEGYEKSDDDERNLHPLIVVEWDEQDEHENPHNWPIVKKFFITILMAAVTLSLYMGASIFTPAEEQMINHFGTSRVKLMLGLTMFVWGYGIGPLFFSPMSENALFGGRNYIYVVSQFLFVVLQIPTALTNHIGPFAVLRVLAGIFASPPLCITPATYNDLFGFPNLTYALLAWAVGGIEGPFLGPLIGAALVNHNSWRWAFWYLLIQSGAVLMVMFFFLPETSSQELLMRKARILRRRTSNAYIVAQGELNLQAQSTRQLLREIFWLPIEITIREVVLLLIDIYLALVYSMVYLFFEAFPLSYEGVYHFNLVQMGMSFLAPLVGCFLLISFYLFYLRRCLILPVLRNEGFSPEKVFGNAAILGTLLFPIGILIYGWTSTAEVHWVVSMVGTLLFGAGFLLSFQSYLAYLGYLYPTRLASAMGSNAVSRAMVGGAFPLFGTVMYEHTSTPRFPVGWGCTIIALAAFAMLPLPIYIRLRGEYLREAAVKKYGDKLVR